MKLRRAWRDRSRRGRHLLSAAVALLFGLALTVPTAPGASAATNGSAGATVHCTSDLPEFGPLSVTKEMGAGTTGFFQLGDPTPTTHNRFIGTCTLSGTIPAGWTVNEAGGAALSATPRSRNGGADFSLTGNLSNSGTVHLTNSLVTVSGNYAQLASAVLGLEVASNDSSGELKVGGDTTLGGTLAVANAPAYSPHVGDTQQVVTAHLTTGRFHPVTGPLTATASRRAWLTVRPAASPWWCTRMGSRGLEYVSSQRHDGGPGPE